MIYLDDAIDALDKRFDSIPIEQTSEILSLRKDLRTLPPVQPEIIRCKDCIHRPIIDVPGAKNGFGLKFPDFMCPCRCDDEYYSWMPNDNWFCGNGKKEEV